MIHSPASRLPLAALLLLVFGGQALAAFTDNGDGTVTDTETGLMWDRCTWGQSGSDCAGGSASSHNWSEGLGVVVGANAASHKGYSDWRLPNRTELESLVDLTTSVPAIDTTAFPNTPSGAYWSSTVFAPDPAFAWLVDFDNGVSFYDGISFANGQASSSHVRLVRSGQSFDALAPVAPAPGVPTPVPALGPWALGLLAVALGLLGLRRRG